MLEHGELVLTFLCQAGELKFWVLGFGSWVLDQGMGFEVWVRV